MRNTIFSFFLLIFGIIGSLVTAEIGIRIWSAVKPAPAPWNDRPPYYFQDDKAENLQDYAKNYLQKPNDTFRIAVVGDSYTFAPYMQFTDAFPKVLERMLSLRDSPLKAQVTNYGVPGFSTNHEIKSVREALAKGADLVLLQITLNDPELKPWQPTGIKVFNRWGNPELSGWRKSLADVSKLYALIEQGLLNRKSRETYKRYHQDLFENPKTWGMFEKSVRTIVDSAHSASKPLVAVVFPLFGFPLDENYPFFAAHEKVKALFKSLDIPILDLYKAYEGMPLERIHVMPGLDRHPNEIAHRVAAEQIYQWLNQQNLIPEPLQIKRLYKGRTQIVKEEPFSF
jgi:lysophospholipase L1-like esterase